MWEQAADPPIPVQVTNVIESVLFTRVDIQMGQEVFLKYGDIEHGSGNWAYPGSPIRAWKSLFGL
jgi:nitric oxide reductase large subunit